MNALARALLFHAAQARVGSKSTELLRRRFRLEELIPDREALMRARGAVTGRDAELFRSIGEAVREEMALVKDTLDMELRTGSVEREQRESSLASLRQLGGRHQRIGMGVGLHRSVLVSATRGRYSEPPAAAARSCRQSLDIG